MNGRAVRTNAEDEELWVKEETVKLRANGLDEEDQSREIAMFNWVSGMQSRLNEYESRGPAFKDGAAR
jgi:hypothetical protein